MVMPDLLQLGPWPVLVATVCIGAAAGVVRGVTGFGAAMVMAPPLALMLGPSATVPLVLLLEGFAAAPMIRQASTQVRWPVMLPIMAAAAACIPVGTMLLSDVDAALMRRLTALVVLGFSLVLLSGLRWQGTFRTGTGLALGSLSGAMLGATSVGGPPVVLYLLSGPDSAAVTRANLTVYVAASSVFGLAALAWRGMVAPEVLALGLCIAPLFSFGVVMGARIFHRLSEQRFRRLTIVLMMVVSAYVLAA